MEKWDDQERNHDEIYDVPDDYDENDPACEEFRDDDKTVTDRIYTRFLWYDRRDWEVIGETMRSEIPDGERFIEIILHNDRIHQVCKEFVIYYDEAHKSVTTAIHIGTYNLEEAFYYAQRLGEYIKLRRYDMIRDYVCHDTIVASKS